MNIKIHLNRDNVITFGLLEGRTPVDANLLTRVALRFKPKTSGSVVTIDSQTVPELFDFTTSEEFSGENTGVLKLILGDMVGVAAGKYTMTVVVYDPANLDGVVWGAIEVQVSDDSA